MRSSGRWVAVILVGCVLLTGCGGGDVPESSDVSATADVSLAGVGQVVWTTTVDASTQAPGEPIAALPNDAPLVIAALPVETLPAGTVLEAHWTIDGDPLPAIDPKPVTVEDGLAGAWVTWTLRWAGDQPWPIGRLGIVVDIDGAEPVRAELPIVRPND